MKRLVEVAFAIKMNACLCFTGILFFCIFGELIFQVPLVNASRALQYMVIAMICGAMQYVFFSGQCLKRWSFFLRSMTFAVLLCAVIAAFAYGFRWFPLGNVVSWAIFLGAFAVVFLVILGAFEFLFRVTGRRYTNLLGEKQSQK